MHSYDDDYRRYLNSADYAPPSRDSDYEPYAPHEEHRSSQAQPIPYANPSPRPHGPTQPVVVGSPAHEQAQHPGLRRESRSYQPPSHVPMSHPGMGQQSYSSGLSESHQAYGTPPGAQAPYGTPPSSYSPISSSSPVHARTGGMQASNLHPESAHIHTPPAHRVSHDYDDEPGVTFDESAYSSSPSHQRPRSYSTASRRSHRSSHDEDRLDGDDGRSRRSSRSSHRGETSGRKKLRELERQPTYGDSVLMVWDKAKELLSSRRD